ncbi:hypothetical protein CABS01_16279 [Colletotrichum abscissum]|uniref:uncharacterized protein n=1 Tax=Colletotrichum abscissum TaxID=1671311 RepID=UPI0027D5441D|nr:uncharacterized protein CABS01_16279 [Colletotrichum abscissum]KAK1472548.1 hypothetical protein CABS01_16279 [Colletotrichum abscissum]KAK1701621.1 hypothetical protein BDP67DRAFT_539616 [Colletotrichum lupini]
MPNTVARMMGQLFQWPFILSPATCRPFMYGTFSTFSSRFHFPASWASLQTPSQANKVALLFLQGGATPKRGTPTMTRPCLGSWELGTGVLGRESWQLKRDEHEWGC